MINIVFTFAESRKRMVIEGEDFNLELLVVLVIKRLVAIELKSVKL